MNKIAKIIGTVRENHNLNKEENNKKSTMSNVPTSDLRHLTSTTAITLIALVITIIVLLILSGVTLNMVIGQNGIFNRANSAKEETKKSQALEDVRMKVLEAQTDKNGQATLVDVVNTLEKTEQDTYKVMEASKVAKLEEGSITADKAKDLDAIYVTNTKYQYEVKVDRMLKVTLTGEVEKEEESQKTYKIKYNANGGEQAPEEQTKKWGEDITLSETKPTKTGYTFLNWNTKEDGTGKSYNVGENYIENEEVMLYAVWKINEYTVTYDRNFLPNNLYTTSDDYSNYVKFQTTFSNELIIDNNVSKGKIGLFTCTKDATADFTGVYYLPEGLTQGKTYTWSVYVKASRDINFLIGQEQGGNQYYNITTNWQRITNTYKANNERKAFVFYLREEDNWKQNDKLYIHSLELQEGDTLNIVKQTKQYNDTLGTLEIPTRTGYTFNGWYTDPIEGTKIDESTKVNNDITYYAHWTYNG